MRKIKEKRMQSYVLRARKMVQEGKNKEGAEMLSEGLNYYSKNIIKALTPYATADAELFLWSCATWQMVSKRTIQGQKNFACGQKTTPQNLNCKKQLR